ncbi:MAG: helix-turn-helix transcriptional regulator [Burkholderiaceae bacterium]|uniref:Helix-turn-helix transcriptional regulator n=1 Tax=Herminiimonas contaminans TaxID=1111140 RepID=A0ABS0EPF8_9BURK|nr:helix-turn-helix transcriptional regulator [Herminiimonas contaminans]MBF8176737.1 helix-turn-helix transcriptional regulator [Herminiimonas contaminans]MBX9798758.1 helix-turn-helix transcriptional regulator [Burkholderiaceae bacterium]
MFGKSENREDYQHIERPAGGMARDLANHHLIDYHQHPRGQLIYAYSGAILVMTELGSWVVPPQRAVWVPPNMMHSMQACGNVEMRTVYVRQDHIPPELTECCVVSVPPLLRELIAAMVHIPLDYDETGRDGLLVQLLLHEIKPLKVVPLHLPMPTDVRLGKICQRILAEPSDETTVDEWSKSIGASARTIVRLFPEQTGLTYSQWKQQARLLAAIQMLATNQNVTDIALQLGYESPSAFSAMFKRAIGLTPTEYFRELFPASE